VWQFGAIVNQGTVRVVIPEEQVREPSVASEVPAPYRTPHEHLADLLSRHDWLLKRRIARGQARRPADILGFAAISEQEVQQLLDVPSGDRTANATGADADTEELRILEQYIAARVDRSLQSGLRLPLVELVKRFALTPSEIDLLIACLAVELDTRYERIYGFLHDDMSRRSASPGLAISLYADDVREIARLRGLLGPLAPLRHYRLLELVEEGAAVPWMSRALRIDERILAFLTADITIDSRIARYVVPLDTVGAQPNDSVERVAQWTDSSDAPSPTLIYVHGPRHSGADDLVRNVSGRAAMPVFTVDTQLLLEPTVDFDSALFLLFREAMLSEAALYLKNLDRAFEPPIGAARHRALLRCLSDLGGTVFASGEQAWCWQLPEEPVALRMLELQPDTFREQLATWQRLAGGAFPADELHRLISLHPLPVSAIREVWRMAQAIAAGEEEGGATTPALVHVRQACRAHTGTPVSSLARRIEPKHRWSDLVLPKEQFDQLAAICSHARHASIVYGEWCFERRLSLGKGLNVLFTGPPGTGKTMAAEVIAAELGVALLKIDLSQIVSKYIGETEKNLRQLFDQATSANAILFFDEADALLGKRSDVKDAHDRYANTETAYLLQKMEEFAGISILATNLRQNMDDAFTRRMRFIVEFPFPEDEDRLRIWRSVWPTEVPLAPDIDLSLLARRFRLSGGSIRNVALSAAFLAAEQQANVSMHHLLRATRRELQKMGRLVNEEEYR
jgi:Winged helix domain, variant/ATPase family associated with various cellular activities (AAA)